MVLILILLLFLLLELGQTQILTRVHIFGLDTQGVLVEGYALVVFLVIESNIAKIVICVLRYFAVKFLSIVNQFGKNFCGFHTRVVFRALVVVALQLQKGDSLVISATNGTTVDIYRFLILLERLVELVVLE